MFRRATVALAIAAMASLSLQVGAAASPTYDETKLTAFDAAAEDHYGWSVAVSGDRIVVGAHDDDNDNGFRSGSVYVYEPDGAGGWTQTDKLTASDGTDGDWYGWSVAVSGDRIVVGAPGDDGTEADTGSAYVYELDGTDGWTETKLTASDGAEGDNYGNSVAVSDDRVVVGAPGDDDKGPNSGSVYVYEPDDADEWTQTDKLTASDGDTYDTYGGSVSMSGDRIVIGASGDLTFAGAVYVYEPDGADEWTETKLTASDGAEGDNYGNSVAVSGNRIVVGAPGDLSWAGSLYVYEPIGGLWTEINKLTASDGAAGDNYGTSVAVSGNRIVAGAYGDDDNGSNAGAVYVYEPALTGDVVPPVLTVPDDITTVATSIDGAPVTYTATATDDVDEDVPVECAPASGTLFPIGDTTVTCSATDTAGNTTTGSFVVTVQVPEGDDGTNLIDAAIDDLDLPTGVDRSLTGRLSQVTALLSDDNPNNDGAACDKLDAFRDTVAERAADGSLTATDAARLDDYAAALQVSFGCDT